MQKGTAVRFDLTNSPCTVDVPNVRTLPQDQAVGLLEAKSIAAGNIVIKNQTVTQPGQDGDRARPGHRGHEHEAASRSRSRSGKLDPPSGTTTTP